ncbi:MAG TPA: polysaccharide deacetylase family protein [Myxococcales bacterium]|jgi:peptidoglycan/xylan/chitin deacetylase (PgdA/CDA1 family)
MSAWRHERLSRAHLVGLTAITLALALSRVPPWRLPFGILVSPAVLPLLVQVALNITGAFVPALGFFLPLITHGSRGRPAVALSFDDGPDPVTTARLLELLARHRTPASFFVIGKQAEAHPELVAKIRDAGHELGNHSMNHDPMLMFRSLGRLEAEIAECQAVLAAQGVRSLTFRPPVGITNPRLGIVLRRLKLGCVCFSCRPLDFGNRRLKGLADRVLARAHAGDIILLHDVAPLPEVGAEVWLAEIEKIVAGLEAAGLRVVPLSDLIGLPLMEAGQDTPKPLTHPAPAGAEAV